MEPSSRITAFAVPQLDRSIPRVLHDIAVRCARLRESRAVCLRVHARLQHIWQHELRDATASAYALQRLVPVLGHFADVLVHFHDTLSRFLDDDDPVFRLILSRQLAVRLHRVHCDISAVVLELVLLSNRAHAEKTLERLALARVQWRADQRVQELLDKQRSGFAAALQRELQSIDAELRVLPDVCAALAADASAYAQSVDSESPTTEQLLLNVGWDTDSRLTLTSWRVRRCDGDGNDADEAIGSSPSQAPRSTERVGVIAQAPQELQLLDESEPQRSLDASKQIVHAHSACHLCKPVAFAIPATAAPATGTSSSTFAQLLATHSEELIRLFASVALRLHVDHESELVRTSESDATGRAISAFGFETLAVSDCE